MHPVGAGLKVNEGDEERMLNSKLVACGLKQAGRVKLIIEIHDGVGAILRIELRE